MSQLIISFCLSKVRISSKLCVWYWQIAHIRFKYKSVKCAFCLIFSSWCYDLGTSIGIGFAIVDSTNCMIPFAIKNSLSQHFSILVMPTQQVRTAQSLPSQFNTTLASYQFTAFVLRVIFLTVNLYLSATLALLVNIVKGFINILVLFNINFGNGKQYFCISEKDGA